MSLEVQIVSDAAGFDALEPEWNELFEQSARRSPPLHFDWMRTWWQIYGPIYAQELVILTIRDAGHLIGLLPLYLSKTSSLNPMRRLAFLSTGEDESEEICADYLDLLCLPDFEAQCINALRPVLTELSWDELSLRDMPANSLLTKLAGTSRSRGTCPIADLTGGFEAYLQRLSANGRQQSRRLMRGAEKAGIQIEVPRDPHRALQIFDELIELHQHRWQTDGEPGVFSAPRFTAFHRALVEKWVPENRAMLWRVALDGKPLAIKYGFLLGDKYDFYQSGVVLDDGCGIKSPGIVSFLNLMSHLSEQGVTCFDFLRGSSQYKERLSTGSRELIELRLVRPGWRSGAHQLQRIARGASHRARRLLQSTLTRQGAGS